MPYFIPVSSVSSICGRNKYNDCDKELFKVLKQRNPNLFNRINNSYEEDRKIHKLNVEMIYEEFPDISPPTDTTTFKEEYETLVKNKKVKKFMSKAETIEPEEFEEAVSVEEKNADEYEDYKEQNPKVVEKIVKAPSAHKEITQTVPENLVRNVHMDRGTEKESSAIEELGRIFGKNMKSDERLVSKTIDNLVIGGRVDQYILNKKRENIGVIEVKTRTRQFFGESGMRRMKYDIDQLACYAFLTGLDEFYLCEYYNNEINLVKFEKEELLERWKILEKILKKKYEMIEEFRLNPSDSRAFEILEKYKK